MTHPETDQNCDIQNTAARMPASAHILAVGDSAKQIVAEAEQCLNLMAQLYGWPMVTPLSQCIRGIDEQVRALAALANVETAALERQSQALRSELGAAQYQVEWERSRADAAEAAHSEVIVNVTHQLDGQLPKAKVRKIMREAVKSAQQRSPARTI